MTPPNERGAAPHSHSSKRQEWVRPREILLVDQDPECLSFLQDEVAGLGLTILTAQSGAEALEKLQAHRPPIVILDLTVSDIDGYEVFRIIRENPETCDTVMIVTHPDPRDEHVFRAFRLRSDCFLGKPIRPADLRLFLHRLLHPQLEIMTFNIRNNRAKDGENHWIHRREFVTDLIRAHQVHVLGVQEAYREQLDELLPALPDYAEIGVGREDGESLGEHSQILYRKDRFRVRAHGTFWFSDTPGVPNSRTWGNRLTRACTWARLEDLWREGSFYVYNLHLDHESQPSRERSVELLLDHIGRRDPPGPVLVMGDFNAGESNPAIQLVKASQTPALRDTFRVAHPDENAAATFHGFGGGTQGEKIDYLFASDKFQVVAAYILRDTRWGRYPSDHYPVTARLDW